MSDAWGVTRFPLDSTEGVTVIELFATESLATAFRDGYAINNSEQYHVTRLKIWNGPIKTRSCRSSLPPS